MTTDDVLAGVATRLRRIRKEREVTLAALSETTGISVSTLSRLEAGLRKPSLELLLPIAQAHQVPLDELVGAPSVGDPRVRAKPMERYGRTFWPLTRHTSPSRVARHDRAPRLLPVPGSENPWHHTSSPASSRGTMVSASPGGA